MFGLVHRPTFRALSPFAPMVRARGSDRLTISLAQLFGGGPDLSLPKLDVDALERKYGESAIVYMAVSRKALDLSRAPLAAKRRETVNGRLAVTPLPETDPLPTLLRQVTPFDATQQWLLQITSMYLDLTGNAFWLVIRDRKGLPIELYPVNPLAVSILPTRYELWHFGESLPLRKWRPGQKGDLLHFRLPSPRSDFGSALPSEWGVGPLEAAWTLVVTDQDAVKWNRSLVKNDGRPSGILTTEQEVREDQAQAAGDRFRATFGGPQGAGKLLVLGGGLKYERLGMTVQEADYRETREDLRAEILAALGTNMAVMGFEVGAVSVRTEQVTQYWQGIVSRSLGHILPVLNEFLAPEFGAGVCIEQDFSGIKELAENEQQKSETATRYFQMGISRARIIPALGLPFTIEPGDEVSYLPISLTPADALEAGGLDGPLLDEPDDDERVDPDARMARVGAELSATLAQRIAAIIDGDSSAAPGHVEQAVAALERVAERVGPLPEVDPSPLVPRAAGVRIVKEIHRDTDKNIARITETHTPIAETHEPDEA